MGTFHDTQDPLHGITVAAVHGDTVFVGRCHERNADTVVLVDVDEHAEGQDGRTNAEYLQRAAMLGTWKKHDRLELPAADLQSLAPLKEYFGGGAPKPAPVAAPTPDSASAEPEVAVATREPVTITAAAEAEVRRLLAAENDSDLGLRLGVAGGGCSGLTYKLEFTPTREGDHVFEREGYRVFLDPKSVIYLRGVTLEFESGLGGKGFRFNNPNATNTCGCGESFSV